jgi:hypothetical protein
MWSACIFVLTYLSDKISSKSVIHLVDSEMKHADGQGVVWYVFIL